MKKKNVRKLWIIFRMKGGMREKGIGRLNKSYSNYNWIYKTFGIDPNEMITVQEYKSTISVNKRGKEYQYNLPYRPRDIWYGKASDWVEKLNKLMARLRKRAREKKQNSNKSKNR